MGTYLQHLGHIRTTIITGQGRLQQLENVLDRLEKMALGHTGSKIAYRLIFGKPGRKWSGIRRELIIGKITAYCKDQLSPWIDQIQTQLIDTCYQFAEDHNALVLITIFSVCLSGRKRILAISAFVKDLNRVRDIVICLKYWDGQLLRSVQRIMAGTK